MYTTSLGIKQRPRRPLVQPFSPWDDDDDDDDTIRPDRKMSYSMSHLDELDAASLHHHLFQLQTNTVTSSTPPPYVTTANVQLHFQDADISISNKSGKKK